MLDQISIGWNLRMFTIRIATAGGWVRGNEKKRLFFKIAALYSNAVSMATRYAIA
jgi:hypothetical protein